MVEYEFAHFGYEGDWEARMRTFINEMAREGWRVVGVVPAHPPNRFSVLLSREEQPPLAAVLPERETVTFSEPWAEVTVPEPEVPPLDYKTGSLEGEPMPPPLPPESDRPVGPQAAPRHRPKKKKR